MITVFSLLFNGKISYEKFCEIDQWIDKNQPTVQI